MSYDITWCENTACPLRPKCGRNSALIDPNYKWPLSHAIFTPGEDGTCEYFMEQENTENEEK